MSDRVQRMHGNAPQSACMWKMVPRELCLILAHFGEFEAGIDHMVFSVT